MPIPFKFHVVFVRPCFIVFNKLCAKVNLDRVQIGIYSNIMRSNINLGALSLLNVYQFLTYELEMIG